MRRDVPVRSGSISSESRSRPLCPEQKLRIRPPGSAKTHGTGRRARGYTASSSEPAPYLTATGQRYHRGCCLCLWWLRECMLLRGWRRRLQFEPAPQDAIYRARIAPRRPALARKCGQKSPCAAMSQSHRHFPERRSRFFARCNASRGARRTMRAEWASGRAAGGASRSFPARCVVEEAPACSRSRHLWPPPLACPPCTFLHSFDQSRRPSPRRTGISSLAHPSRSCHRPFFALPRDMGSHTILRNLHSFPSAGPRGTHSSHLEIALSSLDDAGVDDSSFLRTHWSFGYRHMPIKD